MMEGWKYPSKKLQYSALPFFQYSVQPLNPEPFSKIMTNDHNVSVVTGPTADELEVFAANELCRYLKEIYGISTHPVTGLEANAKNSFFVGNPTSNPAVREASAHPGGRAS